MQQMKPIIKSLDQLRDLLKLGKGRDELLHKYPHEKLAEFVLDSTSTYVRQYGDLQFELIFTFQSRMLRRGMTLGSGISQPKGEWELRILMGDLKEIKTLDWRIANEDNSPSPIGIILRKHLRDIEAEFTYPLI